VKAPIANLADFAALDPFFRIIEQGLDGLAGPGHFFDLLADDITVDYVVTVPGYPRHIEGRAAVAELYRPYGTMIVLDRCFDLAVHHDAAKGVVVLEYASEGHAVGTGRQYSNRCRPGGRGNHGPFGKNDGLNRLGTEYLKFHGSRTGRGARPCSADFGSRGVALPGRLMAPCLRRFRRPALACWRGRPRRAAGGGRLPRAWGRTGTGAS
jgi:uncharacterized protein